MDGFVNVPSNCKILQEKCPVTGQCLAVAIQLNYYERVIFFDPVHMPKFRIGILDFTHVSPAAAASSYRLPGMKTGKLYNPNRRLQDAIKALGHTPVIYKVEKCQMFFDNRRAEILYNNEKVKGCDVVVPRLDFSQGIDLEISIIKQFQLMGIPVINKYLPISRAKNKLRTLQILTKMRIPVPKTIVIRRFEYLDDAVKKVGGYPIIIKSPFGTEGREVVIIESRRSMYSALDIIWRQSQSGIILIQEYVSEATGSDYRAFVVGDRVVAAMKRTAAVGDFRSNLSLGGEAVPVKLTEEEENLAVRATKCLGLEVCGVDILRGKGGPVIMEMNANPGLEGISNVTGVDVATEMIRYAAQVANKNKQK
jgi:ribosomal protein S6--L-glutamate ligase